jgi:hypothetical protein
MTFACVIVVSMAALNDHETPFILKAADVKG